jgi:hypothetical protein
MTSALALDEHAEIIGITHESQATSGQFPIELIENYVGK